MTQIKIYIYLLAFSLHVRIIQMSLVHGNAKNTVICVAEAKRCIVKKMAWRQLDDAKCKWNRK
jgi:hypothetical protein